jgi:MFS family permease
MKNDEAGCLAERARKRRLQWLNRNVVGMSITSFLSDAGHEMVTAVLPGFLGTIDLAAGALGWIEGVSDAASSFVKLGAGWYSDRIGRRKGMVTFGYFLTGTALAVFALAVSWPLILIGRVVSWLGRGIRGPLRDALLSDSVNAEDCGKAFGLHRAGDTAGAVLGPLIGVAVLCALPASDPSGPFRFVFVLSLIPGLAAAAAFALLVRETPRPGRQGLAFWGALRDLPEGYKRFLGGVGLFGLGDFSHTLLILGATQILTPQYGVVGASQWGALLYAWRNLVYAGVSFPIGALADRMNKRTLLGLGYAVGALTPLCFALVVAFDVARIVPLAAIFALAGIYVAAEDALEGAIPADLVPSEGRGTAYGLMGTVNGAGDLIASAMVGFLWTAISPVVSFCSASILMLAGASLVLADRHS